MNKYTQDTRGIGRLLVGPEMRSLMKDRAEMAVALYRAQVAKRTGTLAREVRAETFIGGQKKDRWCGRAIAYAPYAASHEFGTDKESGAHDWVNVLKQMGRI